MDSGSRREQGVHNLVVMALGEEVRQLERTVRALREGEPEPEFVENLAQKIIDGPAEDPRAIRNPLLDGSNGLAATKWFRDRVPLTVAVVVPDPNDLGADHRMYTVVGWARGVLGLRFSPSWAAELRRVTAHIAREEGVSYMVSGRATRKVRGVSSDNWPGWLWRQGYALMPTPQEWDMIQEKERREAAGDGRPVLPGYSGSTDTRVQEWEERQLEKLRKLGRAKVYQGRRGARLAPSTRARVQANLTAEEIVRRAQEGA